MFLCLVLSLGSMFLEEYKTDLTGLNNTYYCDFFIT